MVFGSCLPVIGRAPLFVLAGLAIRKNQAHGLPCCFAVVGPPQVVTSTGISAPPASGSRAFRAKSASSRRARRRGRVGFHVSPCARASMATSGGAVLDRRSRPGRRVEAGIARAHCSEERVAPGLRAGFGDWPVLSGKRTTIKELLAVIRQSAVDRRLRRRRMGATVAVPDRNAGRVGSAGGLPPRRKSDEGTSVRRGDSVRVRAGLVRSQVGDGAKPVAARTRAGGRRGRRRLCVRG